MTSMSRMFRVNENPKSTSHITQFLNGNKKERIEEIEGKRKAERVCGWI
jgi:hypothetical protein